MIRHFLALLLFTGSICAGALGLISLRLATPAEVIDQTKLLLENFNGSIRNNSEGKMLFDAYTGEDPGSSAAVVSSSLQLTGSATTGQSIYMDFLPITASYYPFPAGYAQYYTLSGTWSPDINRLSFIFRCNTAKARRTDGGDLIQVGTYIKNHDNVTNTAQGRHFYHIMDPNIYADRWAKIWINQHPQHERTYNSGLNWPDNVSLYVNQVTGTYGSYGPVSYMDGLSRYYFDPQPAGLEGSIWDFDDFYFYEDANGEPDYDISSIIALYTGTQYEVTWAGEKGVGVTYEIRYKTSSMRVGGFTSGTSGGTATNPGNDYTGCIWQSGSTAEDSNGMCFAIRVQGDTPFTEVCIPYQMGPGNTGDQ